VLLDIAKAYDTVDRAFMLSAMRAHGADDGMLAWTRLLLSDTRAVAQVHGHVSAPAAWCAGVRQGCPLSPLLYLFVAEALCCWLRASPALGVEVAGRRFVSGQYADDTRVMLRVLDEQHLRGLLEHLAAFAAASGQAVNAAKSAAVPLGPWAAEGQQHIAGVPVQQAAKALGVQLTATQLVPLPRSRRAGLRCTVRSLQPSPAGLTPAWASRITRVRARCAMVAASPLSAMGRGVAVGAYALSMVLFHAEHEGLPCEAAKQLQRAVTRAVDRPKRIPGVPSRLLCGAPAVGGFGAVDAAVHTAARHAKRAAALLRGLLEPPILPLPPLPDAAELPGGVEEAPPDPPLAHRPARPPDAGLAHLAGVVLRRVCPSLHPAQTLLLAAYSTEDDARRGRLTDLEAQHLLVPDGPLRNACVALQRLGHLVATAPLGDDVRSWLSTPGVPGDEVWRGVEGLVWAVGGGGVGPAGEFSVRDISQLLMEPTARERERVQRAYAAQAFASAPQPLPAEERAQRTDSFIRSLAVIWRLPWGNTYKEPLWRLSCNGVQGAGGHGIVHRRQPCVCGYSVPARCQDSTLHRQHAFWDCPVAVAVRQQVQRGLGPDHRLQQWHLWLCQKPRRAHVCPVVWRVVAVAALHAMDRGRAVMWHHHHNSGDMTAAEVQQAAGERAAAEFWLALQVFAQGAQPDSQRGWGAVQHDHPFLCVRVEVPGPPRIAVQLPPA
jgi:hypothetical protein